MTVRQQHLESIAATTADYRAGELPAPTPEHVDRWVSQFNANAQLMILSELDHVLRQIYFSRERVIRFLSNLVTNQKLAGDVPCTFWRNANFLDIQKHGHSQKEMLELFGEILKDKCDLDIDDCGSDNGIFIFIDDAIFSGTGIKSDLIDWIKKSAPNTAIVHVITIALYTGSWWSFKQIEEAIKSSNKNIKIKQWRAIELENRKSHKNDSEVYWPTGIPNYADVQQYVASEERFAFEPRAAGGKTAHSIFSSEEGRQALELHLLSAGVKIRGFCADPKPILRPLGFSQFGLGFGSTIVTFRNCPNNAPLSFWWGDPAANKSHPFSKWYPLFPRKTYSREIDLHAIFGL